MLDLKDLTGGSRHRKAGTMKQEFFLDWSPDARDHAALLQRLVGGNLTRGGPSGHRNMAVMLRDPDTGDVVSGVWGVILYGWLNVEMIYVDEPDRRQGLGSRLLASVEDAARKQGCIGSWLIAYGFQPAGFYEKNGYRQFGELDALPPTSSDSTDRRALFYRKSFPNAG